MTGASKKHQEQDELIIATILAAKAVVEKQGRTFTPTMSERIVRSADRAAFTFGASDRARGPCCAIGAGILYAGLNAEDYDASTVFAETYGVSRAYAIGVSDGFEGDRCSEPKYANITSRDYLRGVAVGEAIYDAAFGL